jgi:hypothetical protein
MKKESPTLGGSDKSDTIIFLEDMLSPLAFGYYLLIHRQGYAAVLFYAQ